VSVAAEQGWPSGVPDTALPEFDLECQRQSRLVAQADAADVELQRFMDEALDDLPG